MSQVSIPNATVTKIANAGPRDFLHVQNNVSTTFYVTYDGTVPVGAAGAYGYPLTAGSILQLNNDGQKPVFNKEVYAYQASGGAQLLTLQGV